MSRALLIASVASVSLGGCATLPGVHQDARPDRVDALRPATPAQWRYEFGDVAFRSLLDQADLQSLDVKAALARAQAADAALASARAEGRPNLGAAFGASRVIPGQRPSQDQTATRAALDAGLNGAWAVDLSGRISSAIAAADADKRASAIEVEIARATLASELARAYVSVRVADDRLVRLARREANEREALALAQRRLQAGLTPSTEVLSRTQTLAAIAQDQISARLTRKLALTRLAVLSGKSPGAVEVVPADLRSLAPNDAEVHTDLALQRYDVTVAEARLAAADARRLEAARAALPRLSLGLTLGSSGNAGQPLFQRRNLALTPTVRIDGAILDGGAAKARARTAGSLATEAEAVYVATRLRAEEALVAVADRRAAVAERERPTLEGLAAAQAQFRSSRLRLEAGRESRLESLDAERALIDAEERAADLRRECLDLSIDLEAARLGLPTSGSAP